MNILEVVNNLVCRDHLFSFLEVDDLLELRRVSKKFKDEAEDFIRTKKVTTESLLAFNLYGDDPFKEFNDFRSRLSGLPNRTRTYITFSRKRGRMLGTLRQLFFDTYGTSITHLCLSGLTLPLYSESKFQFFDAFPNVIHLWIETVYPPSKNEIPSPTSSGNAKEIKIPASFAKLKSLGFLEVATTRSIPEKQRAFDFVAKLVEICLPTLENLQLPGRQFGWEGVDMQQVTRLLCTCLFTGPKLKFPLVSGRYIEDLLEPNQRTPEMRTVNAMMHSINEKIRSIKNPRSETFHLELPNLELIYFTNLSECRMPATGEFVRRNWPELKEIVVDLKDYPGGGSMCPSSLDVWDFLFGNGIRRENVVRLKIDFDGFEEENVGAAREQTLPRTMDLTTSCPNLKILQLKNETKQLVSLHQLWEGLPLLEKVHLKNWKDLADSDFIGGDPQNPVFWNLKNLKILKLTEINGVQLTNGLLSKVLYNMPILHLKLSSDDSHPYKHSITLRGITSLLYGRFASTVEVLLIHDLHIRHVSNQKKVDLVRRFKRDDGLWRMS